MTGETKICLVCEQTDQFVPLITVTYAGLDYHICPGHLPILIHHPEQLTGKLPGAANITPHVD
ncbi:MAG: hypothetical protein C0391_08120 [Anaerolinea sp.]|nr:hypothetical protein [Anaerolinea sp.]